MCGGVSVRMWSIQKQPVSPSLIILILFSHHDLMLSAFNHIHRQFRYNQLIFLKMQQNTNKNCLFVWENQKGFGKSWFYGQISCRDIGRSVIIEIAPASPY